MLNKNFNVTILNEKFDYKKVYKKLKKQKMFIANTFDLKFVKMLNNN